MLEDRVVVVAGAAGNLGRVVVREFARDGARVALLGSRREHLEETVAEFGLDEERALIAPGDLRRKEAALAAVARVVERFGRLDVLVQAVGGWLPGAPLAAVAAEDLRSMLEQHVWTTLNLLQAVLPRMTGAGWGRIVAISAPAAADAPARGAVYAAAKAAQEAIVRSAAHEIEGSGVTANVIVVRAIEARPADGGEKARGRGAATTPEEIAAAIRYLCSDDASRINGVRLPMYGG